VYWYSGGFNPVALLALAAGIAVCVPGFVTTTGLAEFAPFWERLYSYAWFVSFAVAFVVYWVGMAVTGMNRHRAE
jgi:NCS1 family nucleobase:cation symporter-1